MAKCEDNSNHTNTRLHHTVQISPSQRMLQDNIHPVEHDIGRRESHISNSSFCSSGRIVTHSPPYATCGPALTENLPAYPQGVLFHNEAPISMAGIAFDGFPPPQFSMNFPIQDEINRLPEHVAFNQPRPSIQMIPYGAIVDPHMIMRHHNPYQQASPYSAHNSFSEHSMNMYPATSIPTSMPTSYYTNSAMDQYGRVPTSWQHSNTAGGTMENRQSPASTSDAASDDEEEGQYDKPYAQLIYEALYNAPGKRMLLRDIYEWFVQNTSKPRESGTNGWQNSIRHNLSMNQAFENDKSDPASARGARKANSVWVLTDHAIKNGVQSTTRYRKTGTAKKGMSNKSPAIQRQRSGAKGGRAARRTAARLRKLEDTRRTKNTSESGSTTSFNMQSPASTIQDEWSTYSQSPATPLEDVAMASQYCLPQRSYCQYDEEADHKFVFDAFLSEDERLHQMLSASTAGAEYEDLPQLPTSELD